MAQIERVLRMDHLTTTQSRALAFITDRVSSAGTPPTLREICLFMGYSSVGSAQDLIQALRKKGYLEIPGKQTARSFILTDKARVSKDFPVSLDPIENYRVPCLGAVPAGEPLEAIEERVGTLVVAASLFSTPKPRQENLFGLRANGLSMIGAGILDGDWLIINSQREADRNNIVVARVDGEATVKRLMLDKAEGWFLQPENPDFPRIFASAKNFEIIGRVVALQRNLVL